MCAVDIMRHICASSGNGATNGTPCPGNIDKLVSLLGMVNHYGCLCLVRQRMHSHNGTWATRMLADTGTSNLSCLVVLLLLPVLQKAEKNKQGGSGARICSLLAKSYYASNYHSNWMSHYQILAWFYFYSSLSF